MFSESFAKATFGFSNVLFITVFTFNHINKIVWFASDVLFDLTCLTRGAERVGGSTVIYVTIRLLFPVIKILTFKLGRISCLHSTDLGLQEGKVNRVVQVLQYFCSKKFAFPTRETTVYLYRHKCYYYSFKISSRFWLVKTTRIIHLNQLLFTKFGKNLRHIESVTSKVQPAADYWTVDRENLGTRLCYFWWAEKQRA